MVLEIRLFCHDFLKFNDKNWFLFPFQLKDCNKSTLLLTDSKQDFNAVLSQG